MLTPKLNKDFTLLAKFTGSRVTWYIPTTVTELLQIKKEHPNAHIVAGNTGKKLSLIIENIALCYLITPSNIAQKLGLYIIVHPCDPTVVICYLIWPCDII